MKTVHFYDYLYKVNLLFVIGKKEECEKELHRLGHHIQLGQGDGMTTFNVDYGIVIWLADFKKNPRWLSCLVHEITHAATEVMDDIGWKFDSHNDEPFAYYCGWITKVFLEKYK
jgi:hypothetical protein